MHRAAVQEERGKLLIPAIAAALLVGALGLWLSAATLSSAEQVTDTQGVGVTVGETIAWNPVGCIPDAVTMQQQSFDATPGTVSDTLPAVACVSSNSDWNVTAQMTVEPSKSGGGTVPADAFSIERLSAGAAQTAVDGILPGDILPAEADQLLAAGAGSCEAPSTTCALDTPQTIVNGAPGNRLGLPGVPDLGLGIGGVTLPTGLFVYDYRLDTPPTQAAGDYENGVVTFTASN